MASCGLSWSTMSRPGTLISVVALGGAGGSGAAVTMATICAGFVGAAVGAG
jgi:hypothetical protein